MFYISSVKTMKKQFFTTIGHFGWFGVRNYFCSDLIEEQYKYLGSELRAHVRFDKWWTVRQWQQSRREERTITGNSCYYWATVTRDIPQQPLTMGAKRNINRIRFWCQSFLYKPPFLASTVLICGNSKLGVIETLQAKYSPYILSYSSDGGGRTSPCAIYTQFSASFIQH